MSKKNKPAKPTGKIGPVKITGTAEGTRAKFSRIEFPSTKADIEQFIVNSFLRLAPAAHVFPHEGCSAEQNPEQDLDFTLNCEDKRHRKLELMEIAPLEHVRGSYEAAPTSYKPYDMAQYVLSKLLSKSSRYGPTAVPELYLLMYITAWQFTLSETVTCLLQYWTHTTAHNFTGIYLYMPIDKSNGVSRLIYPTPAEHWKTFDADSYRDNEVTNLHPEQWMSRFDGE